MSDRYFHLEINSLADFLTLVAIIRGEPVDLAKLDAARKTLLTVNNQLETALAVQPAAQKE